MTGKPAFIITIDTEPDNQWRYETFDKTENLRFIPRFQELCERFGFKPVYLTEYNAVKDPFFIEYMDKKLAEGICETGMHLHPWSTPPFIQITGNDCKAKPYLTDYPPEIIEEKIASLAGILREKLGGAVSHRAGRWAVNTGCLRLLKKYGVFIDCSVLPFHRVPPSSGEFPLGSVDYSNLKNGVYEIDDNDFKKKGTSGFFEVPMTAFDFHPALRKAAAKLNAAISERKFGPRRLRPEQGNLADLLNIVKRAEREKFPFIEFMLHSSELMPGCSLAFPDAASIENLYADLETLFFRVSKSFSGMTLREYVGRYRGGNL